MDRRDDRPLLAILRLARPQRRKMAFGLLLAVVTALSGLGLLVLSGWFIAASAVAGAVAATAIAFNFASPSAGIRGLAVLRTGSRTSGASPAKSSSRRAAARVRPRFWKARGSGTSASNRASAPSIISATAGPGSTPAATPATPSARIASAARCPARPDRAVETPDRRAMCRCAAISVSFSASTASAWRPSAW